MILFLFTLRNNSYNVIKISKMTIVAKELDQYESVKTKGKFISEFIIYLLADGSAIEAHLEYGTIARDLRIKQISERNNVLHITNQFLIT